MKKRLIYILIGVILALVVFLMVKSWWNSRPDIRFGKDRVAVITEMKTLGRFETAQFSIDKIIEASTDYEGLRKLLFGDKILLVAHGQVIAGFDLSTLTAEDFEGSGKNIIINLPPPQIFTVRIDNQSTKVFDRRLGILTKGDINLEAQARVEAEGSIKSAACESGILEVATQNGKKQLEVIFKAAGFENVSVIAEKGECK